MAVQGTAQGTARGATSGEARQALSACRGAFGGIFLFSFFINLLMLVSPLYMLQVYDRVLASRSTSTLVALTVLAGGLLLVMGALELIRSRILVRIGDRINARLSGRLFAAVFRQSLAGAPGRQAQALRDLDGLRQFLTGQGPFALCDAPWVPVYLAVVFLFHPWLGLIATVGAVVIFVIALLGEILTRDLLAEANQNAQAAATFAGFRGHNT